MPKLTCEDDSFQAKRRFIRRLGKALHQMGTPAFRWEAYLNEVSLLLNVKGQYLATPTYLTFVFGDVDLGDTHTEIMRVTPGDLDLGKLADVDRLVHELIDGAIDIEQADFRIRQIANINRDDHLGQVAAFALTSLSFAILMGTNWYDVFFSGLLGGFVYGMIILASKNPRFTMSLEATSSLLTAFIATALSFFVPSINPPLIVLSAIIVFIPGLALTMGLEELAQRSLISGTARVMDALMMMFKLLFGAMIGLFIGHFLFPDAGSNYAVTLPLWSKWVGIMGLSLSLLKVFSINPEHWFWSLLSGIIAYAATTIASHYFGYSLGCFIGALAVGLYSNFISHQLRTPSSIFLLQGIIILVPGSKAYMGLNALIDGSSMVAGNDIGNQVLVILMSIIGGLIFANTIIRPKKLL